MKGLTLTIKEQAKLQILNTVMERRWSMREAAEVLGVSERHAWRLLAAYRKEGAAALAHGVVVQVKCQVLLFRDFVSTRF